MIREIVCVLRDLSFGGRDMQFVPLDEVPPLEKPERLFFGHFRCHTESHGPSGSHSRTVCVPVDKPAELVGCLHCVADRQRVPSPGDQPMVCVLRNVAARGEDVQYVPLSEVPPLEKPERVFFGRFTCHQEKRGPSGSHTRTICLPLGKPAEYMGCLHCA